MHVYNMKNENIASVPINKRIQIYSSISTFFKCSMHECQQFTILHQTKSELLLEEMRNSGV